MSAELSSRKSFYPLKTKVFPEIWQDPSLKLWDQYEYNQAGFFWIKMGVECQSSFSLEACSFTKIDEPRMSVLGSMENMMIAWLRYGLWFSRDAIF